MAMMITTMIMTRMLNSAVFLFQLSDWSREEPKPERGCASDPAVDRAGPAAGGGQEKRQQDEMDQLEALQQRLANQRKAREIEDAKDEEEVERVSEFTLIDLLRTFFPKNFILW